VHPSHARQLAQLGDDLQADGRPFLLLIAGVGQALEHLGRDDYAGQAVHVLGLGQALERTDADQEGRPLG